MGIMERCSALRTRTRTHVAAVTVRQSMGDGGIRIAIMLTQLGSTALSNKINSSISAIIMVEKEETAGTLGLRQSSCLFPLSSQVSQLACSQKQVRRGNRFCINLSYVSLCL